MGQLSEPAQQWWLVSCWEGNWTQQVKQPTNLETEKLDSLSAITFSQDDNNKDLTYELPVDAEDVMKQINKQLKEYDTSYYIHAALNKYGIDNFEFSIIDYYHQGLNYIPNY